MGAIRAQSYAEDRASGAQVIDGSVYFNADKNQYLTRTFSSAGNRRTFTWSGWVKRDQLATMTSNKAGLFGCDGGSNATSCMFTFDNSTNDTLRCENDFSSGDMAGKTVAVYRDVTGWYHVCIAVDSTQSSVTDGLRFYVNGQLETLQSTSWSQNTQFEINAAIAHCIASDTGDDNRSFGGLMSQVYFIDGQSLDASYFGFTDPLTGTWRPKKYDGATTTSFMWPLASAIVDTFNTVSFTENGGSTSFTSAGTNSFGLSNCADYADDGKYLSYAIYPAKKWTIDFYVKFDDVTSGLNSYIAGWNGTGGGNCCFGLTKSNSTFTVWGDTNLSSSTVASTGTWYQVRMASAGSTNLKLYVNGTLIATDSGNDQDPVTPLTFGDIQSGRFNGQLAGIRYVPDDLGAPTAGGEVSTGGLLPNVKTIGVNYGINGFHLPLDGSAPIGNDQSGNGNDWTSKLPVSIAIDKATGGLPVYNTQNGGYIIASPEIRGQASIGVTVYNPTGSQNRYYFDGVEAPSYNFARGQNVTFDLSDSTVATHQLKFSTTSDGTHGGGSAYDTGAAYGAISAGTVGAATTITFPHNAENTLYYYCVNHSGMGGSVGLTTDIQRADTYASDCVLAVPLYDVEDGTSWEDLSNKMNPNSAEKTITDNGARARGTYQDYWNFYRRACYFDASDDYVSIAGGYADLGLGSGAFTIEGWAYTGTDGTANQVIITSKRYYQGGYDGNWIIRRSNNSQLLFGSFDGTGNDESNQFTCDFSKDCWHHFAFVRNSTGTNGCTMYVDGIDCGNMTVSKDLDDGNTSGIFMGTEHNSGPGDNKWDGFMQDIRIYKGVAKYTSEFIPAATRPSILPSTPAGVSYGSQLEKPTSGAVSLNPAGDSGDYLSIATSSDFEFGTGDYTIEFWFYRIATGQGNIYEGRDGGNTNRILFYVNSANRLSTYINASQNNGSTLTTDRWYHAALSRSSGTNRMFLDGVLQTSWADTVDVDQPSSTFWIGKDYTGSNDFQGFLSNFRVVKGTALYTAGFTPSTKPLTTTSQGATASEVKLLCCQSSLAANTASVTPSALGPSNQSYRDSTTASQNWDSSSASSSTSAALGPDDIYWVDLGQSTKVSKITFDVACSASANLTLTNFIIYYSTSSSSTGSSICYSGCTQTYNNTYTGSAPGTVSVTYEGIIPVSAQYIGVTNGSGSYSGTLTYSNLVVTARPLASEFNPFDTNIDYVSSEPSEYATLNPLSKNSNVSLTNGNLAMSISSSGHYSSIATLGMTTGKYYWEVGAGTGWSNDPAWGIVGEEADHYDDQTNSNPGAWVRNNGRRYYEGTEGDVWMTASQMNVNSGNTLGLAYDGTAGTLQVFVNGIDQGIAYTGLKNGMTRNLGSGTSNRWYPAFKMYDGGPINVNFGQKPFKFAPPKGFLPLCASNLERPQFARPDQYVGVATYNGNGGTQQIPYGFQPDLIFGKPREATTGGGWNWVDSVRGGSVYFMTNSANGDGSFTGGSGVTFNSRGTSVVDTANGDWNLNGNYGGTYVGNGGYVYYGFKAGGNAGTFNKDGVDAGSAAAAGVSDGSITPTACSVGTREGFSIIKYTSTGSNATVGHGLNATPQCIMVKNTDNNNNWHVYHEALGNTKFLYLDLDYAADTGAGAWNNTSPTSTVFSLGTGNGTNSSSNHEYMAYCWCNKPGLQKFGSYVGNGNSDGVFVGLDFRPSLLIIKNADDANEGWVLWDNVRQTFNNGSTTTILYPNATTAENDDSNDWDILSNGMKWRSSGNMTNKDNSTYIYCAWADIPFHNLYGATGPGR